jgi:hypothetical protein
MGLSACAQIDPYLSRDAQCQLLDVARVAAEAKGLTVEQYVNVNDIFICAEVDGTKLEVAE